LQIDIAYCFGFFAGPIQHIVQERGGQVFIVTGRLPDDAGIADELGLRDDIASGIVMPF